MTERTFAGYRLREILGRGASATVVEAEAPDGGAVALKIPHPHAQGPHLEREAARAMAVRSPRVVRVDGVVRQGPDRALVLELVRGRSLADVAREGVEDVARVAADLAEGLAAIHDATEDGLHLGLVHGDVSPGNVLIDAHGRAKLTDLGLSRRRALSALSQSGAIQGTLGYVAPEVIRGQAPSPRSDVFALGVVIYERVCGGPAFEGRTDLDRLRATVEQPLAPAPGPLGGWLSACTAKRPERRPSDGAAAARALAAVGIPVT